MTTIILTIIGILLAAAAALMVIFYGGDAFNSGSIGAQANTLQNAGTNVEAAATLFKTENAEDALTVSGGAADSDLVAGGYLKESPALTGVGTANLDISGGVFQVSNVSGEVCAKVNENLGQDGTPSTKMGCTPGATAADPGTFYATL